MAELQPGTPEYDQAVNDTEKRVDVAKWSLIYLLGSQCKKEPENTSFVYPCMFESDYFKALFAKYYTKLGFKVYKHGNVVLFDLRLDWSHDPKIIENVILPQYKEEEILWKDIVEAIKSESNEQR